VTNAGPRPRVRNKEATDEFEPSRTAYETVGQPMGAAVEWWKIGTRIPSGSSPEAHATDYTNLPLNGGGGRIFTCNFDCVIVTQKAAVRLPEQVMPMDALLYLSYPSEMVRKTGFDSVALCSPSTCSAWLSYFLNKMSRRKTRRRARCDREGMYGVYSNSRSSARNGAEKTGFSEMVAAAGFDTRNLQVLSNQYPGGPLPDKGAELEKGVTPPVASAWATLRIICINSG